MAGVAFQASAQVSGLYNTGVDSSGAVLPNGTISDPHYILTSIPSGSPTDLSQVEIVTSAFGYPISTGGWLGDDSASAWLTPNPAGNPAGYRSGASTSTYYSASDPHTDLVGQYIYKTTFQMGNNAVAISGEIATDDAITDIYLNGKSLGITVADGTSDNSWVPFTIDASDFSNFNLNGVNTLDFDVYNDGSITGLRVEWSPVPEPTTMVAGALLLLPFGMSTLRMLRRKQTA